MDTHRIDANAVRYRLASFPINDLLDSLKNEFARNAQNGRFVLRVVPCNVSLQSDPHVLQQLIHDVMTRALKRADRGKLLLGCRRHEQSLSIEIWESRAAASKGKDAPPIVASGNNNDSHFAQRLEGLPGHWIKVRVKPDGDSVFSIDVPYAVTEVVPQSQGAYFRHQSAQYSKSPAASQAGLPSPVSVIPGGSRMPPVVFVVEDDENVRDAIQAALMADNWTVEAFSTCETFLAAYRPGREACLTLDAYLPGMNGIELLQRLNESGYRLPTIMITGHGDVPMAVHAMQAGAVDFIQKPVTRRKLLASIERALAQAREWRALDAWREDAVSQIANLTTRQREVLDLVLAGHPNKKIAEMLAISQRTVDKHRAQIMRKTHSKSLPELTRMGLAAAWKDADGPFVQGKYPPGQYLAPRRPLLSK